MEGGGRGVHAKRSEEKVKSIQYHPLYFLLPAWQHICLSITSSFLAHSSHLLLRGRVVVAKQQFGADCMRGGRVPAARFQFTQELVQAELMLGGMEYKERERDREN